MAYASVQNVKDRFANDAELRYLFDGRSQTDTDTLIQAALDETQGFVDSFIGAKWLTPVDTTSYPQTAALLRGCVLDLWMLFAVGGRDDSLSETKMNIIEIRREWLKLVKDGSCPLTGAVAIPVTASHTVIGEWGSGDADTGETNSTRLLSRESLAQL